MAETSYLDIQNELAASYEQVLSLTQSANMRQAQRREKYDKIKRDIRTTSLVVIIVIAVIVGISDLLSIIDLGWITSWLSTLLMWLFLKNRISAIEKATENMGEFAKELSKELAAIAPGTSLGDSPSVAKASYTHIFLRDTIITQVIELVPGIDILPFYLGQFMKTLIDQQKRRKMAQDIINYCGQLIDSLDAAENAKTEQVVAPIYEHIIEINKDMELAFE
jgi:hypothetical protein